MLLTTRNVQILSLFCAVCCLTLAFPTQTPSAYDDNQSLQVNIPHFGAVFARLGSSISIPCLVVLSSTPTTSSSSSSPIVPRIKWTVVSGGVETQILVARGQRVKVNEAYQDRAALLNYTSSPNDLSLWLGDVRSSDSGYYRCEVQQGLEDTSDLVELKVKGVVFHYRDALGRYAFTYHQAQRACQAIGAEIATPDQLLAAYYDGYEQCDAGWLADQSVRYPIQVPREGCYGDMDGQPGVRNYGTMDADNLFDVYCYVEKINGEVFFNPIPQQLSFDEAQSYCREAEAKLATTAQLYLAWSEGLDHCSPGWLSDGSVRYPIITPRERCGGTQPGVKTLYRFRNQTGFPEVFSLHDVYCFRDKRNVPTDSTVDYIATEPEDIEQDVVILREADQELQLNQHAEQVEREAQSALESFPFFLSPSAEGNLFDKNTTITLDTTESSINPTSRLDLVQPFDQTLFPTEISYDSHNPTALINNTISSTETYDFQQNSSLLPTVYNETDSQMNFTFHLSELEIATRFSQPSYEPHTHNQTVPHATPEEHSQPSEMPKESLEIQGTNLDLNISQTNDSETDSNHTQEENILDTTSITSMAPDTLLQVNLEEASVEDHVQMSFPTQSPTEEGELLTQPTKSPDTNLTSWWIPIDGSGDSSQDRDLDIEATSYTSISDSSTSAFTTHLSPSDSASSLPSEPRTTVQDPTLPSSSQNIDIIGFNILSTATQLEFISRQEGSTSLESDDIVTMESEEKHLFPTISEESPVSGEGLATTESPEKLNASQLSTDSIPTQYRTSGYNEYLNPTTKAYEEASGQEPAIVTSTLEGDLTVGPALEEDLKESKIHEEHVTNVAEFNVSLTPGEETKVSNTLDVGVNISPQFEEFDLTVDPTLSLEGNNVSPTFAEEDTIAPTLALAEEVTVIPTPEEERKIGVTLEEENGIVPTLEEENGIVPTLEEENGIVPTLEEEVNIVPTLEENINIAPILALEEETKVYPTLQEDFTVIPLHSLTSNWPLLTTTAGPQESLNDLEYSRKPPVTTTAALNSSSSTRSSVATTRTTTILTTRHWSRRTMSPTTPITRLFHKTTNPQKVTHLIPPVDHGLVDVEYSLTQPPTLLILPNERAAVGGAGKSSDACVNDPCLNGGTCSDQDGHIKCLCLPTYGGDFCQTDLEQCEPGWDKFQGFCYRHFSQRLSWEVAEKHCRMLGAHLVSIMTPEEQHYINSNYKEYQWTGLNDKTIEDDFRWSDGNPLLYENWYRGQPDSYFLSGEDCVVMVWHDDGRWSDVPCNYHLAYTCKKSTSSCGPPPKVRNTSHYGKVRQRYETGAVVRYRCTEGFQQRFNPLIRCLSGGRWERPHILCIPEAGVLTQYLEVVSPTDSFAAFEDEIEATKDSPQYWDIKF